MMHTPFSAFRQIKDIKGENEECIKQIVTEKDLLIKKYLDEISKVSELHTVQFNLFSPLFGNITTNSSTYILTI